MRNAGVHLYEDVEYQSAIHIPQFEIGYLIYASVTYRRIMR